MTAADRGVDRDRPLTGAADQDRIALDRLQAARPAAARPPPPPGDATAPTSSAGAAAAAEQQRGAAQRSPARPAPGRHRRGSGTTETSSSSSVQIPPSPIIDAGTIAVAVGGDDQLDLARRHPLDEHRPAWSRASRAIRRVGGADAGLVVDAEAERDPADARSCAAPTAALSFIAIVPPSSRQAATARPRRVDHAPVGDRHAGRAQAAPWPRARPASRRPPATGLRAAAAIARSRAASSAAPPAVGPSIAAAQRRPVRSPAAAGTPARSTRRRRASSSSSGRVEETSVGTGLRARAEHHPLADRPPRALGWRRSVPCGWS